MQRNVCLYEQQYNDFIQAQDYTPNCNVEMFAFKNQPWYEHFIQAEDKGPIMNRHTLLQCAKQMFAFNNQPWYNRLVQAEKDRHILIAPGT